MAACSSLLALVQQFGTLNRKLLGAASSNPATLATQLNAACNAIQGCALLSNKLRLGRSDSFRLASSLELVFGAGLHLLNRRRVQNLSVPLNMVGLLVECNHQLAAVGRVLQHTRRQPDAAAAFMRTAGRPQSVLPWLLAVNDALLALPPDFEERSNDCLRSQGFAERGE